MYEDLPIWKLHLISFYQYAPLCHFPHTLIHLCNHTINLLISCLQWLLFKVRTLLLEWIIIAELWDLPPTSTILLISTTFLLVKLLLILFKCKVLSRLLNFNFKKYKLKFSFLHLHENSLLPEWYNARVNFIHCAGHSVGCIYSRNSSPSYLGNYLLCFHW